MTLMTRLNPGNHVETSPQDAACLRWLSSPLVTVENSTRTHLSRARSQHHSLGGFPVDEAMK